MSLLRPSGPFGTGTITAELTDPDRTAHLASSRMGRALRVQLWYPGVATPGAAPLVWSALRRNPATPLPLRLLLSLIRSRTSATPRARILAGASLLPLVVYNHGMVSFADENTSLMEDLASHGYVVLAIEHAEQMQELQTLNRTRSREQRKQDAVLVRQLKQASRNERSSLAPGYYRASPISSRIVIERARDTSFVLRRVQQIMQAIPGIASAAVDSENVCLIGYSIGGAVSMEAARGSAVALSVVNIDGGMQGSLDAEPIRIPVLMLYSESNDGINDQLLPRHAEKLTLPGTTHLGFHDFALLMPGLRHLGATGKMQPGECLARRNQAVRTFISGMTRASRMSR